MTKHELLKEVVSKGSDLTIASSINRDVLRELASLAQQSGAKLTLTTSMNSDLLLELSTEYGDDIAFVHGLSSFKKDN